jgi:endonuclease YncB( thermonuclease family)
MMAPVAEPAKISTKAPAPLILQPVTVTAVHDGDTFHVSFAMHVLLPGATPGWSEDVRLAHVNAPELNTPLGVSAKAALDDWVRIWQPDGLRLHVWGRDKYGRLLADLESLGAGGMLSRQIAAQAGTTAMLVAEQLRGQAST